MNKKKITQPKWKRNLENSSEKKYHLLSDNFLKEIPSNYLNTIPFLTMDRRNLTKALIRIELFKKIIDVPGCIVECGSYRGNGIGLYSLLSSILEPYNYNRKIISFDTFSGFKSVTTKDPTKAKLGDLKDVNLRFLKSALEISNLNRPIGHLDKVELVIGDACKEIPKYVKKNKSLIVSLLYLDFDIYKPTAIALKHLFNLVPKGGVVAFDEFAQKKWEGETIAAKEHIDFEKYKIKKFYYDPHIAYIVK